jgi:diguanylate cyclase (GGDEF)-like protein
LRRPSAAREGVAAATFILRREGAISNQARTDLKQGSRPDPVDSRDAVAAHVGAPGPKLDGLVQDFARFIDSEVALLCHVGNKGQAPTVISSWGLAAREEILRLLEGGLGGRALPLPRAALVPLHPLLDEVLVNATDPPLAHAVEVSVRLADGVRGRLIAGFLTPPTDPALTLWVTEAYAGLIALCLYDGGALDGLLAAGQRDDLTGCLTYEGTHRELEREINRSARGGLALSVCFIDIDEFKRINDGLGHLGGNEILAQVGGILREGVRSCDTVGRYGGDEFVAILPETSELEARGVAERLCSRLTSTTKPLLDGPLTASIGIAQWTPGTDGGMLLAAADSALITAKALRMGVITASEASETQRTRTSSG